MTKLKWTTTELDLFKKQILSKRDKINDEVWVKPDDDSYFFKKSHAIAYAIAIVVQLNSIVEGVN